MYELFLLRSEYRVFWKCCSAGCIYAFTQLCKMMILATFFPPSAESTVHGQISVVAVSKENIHLFYVVLQFKLRMSNAPLARLLFKLEYLSCI